MLTTVIALVLAGGQTLSSEDQIVDHHMQGQLLVDGSVHAIDVRRSGSDARIRMPAAMVGGDHAMVANLDLITGEALVFPIGRAVPQGKRAAYQADITALPLPDLGWEGPAGAPSGRTDEIAGESCEDHVAQAQNAYGEIVMSAACVTSDGVLLRQSREDETLWLAESLTRGPQPATLFQLPPGYEIRPIEALADTPQEDTPGWLSQVAQRQTERVGDRVNRRIEREVDERARDALDDLFGG